MQAITDATGPTSIYIIEKSKTYDIIKKELKDGLNTIFASNVKYITTPQEGCLIVATSGWKGINEYITPEDFNYIGNDGFIIKKIDHHNTTIITANNDVGVLYGVFHYLRMIQTDSLSMQKNIIKEKPSYLHRILNHWDNLDGTVERGYAGHSIWQWDNITDSAKCKYRAYARANASIGINGTILNNVNANPDILKKEYLEKVKIIADELRPYGIKVYLSINFSSPSKLSKLTTSDPLDTNVQNWWNNKAKEIYLLIPDFGGFLVKANSEGLPGPQDYGRSHADGANMLADVLEPYGGIVMWRAFVYSPGVEDRAKQAYNEFVPLDGRFRSNVIIQVKNGPIDFQPREPFNPLFGAMEQTTLMPELQITQEYLGFSDHLVYLGTLFEEFLNTDTYARGKNTTIAKITDGRIFNDSITAIAGVANIGLDTNWCGHHFAQANWYAFGRLSWNNSLSAETIAKEWLRQTFTHDDRFVQTMTDVMMESREAAVNYMTPLGLHHLMGWGHHYGPEPWCEVPGARPDWLPSYYHRADSSGIGFDRSSTGSKATDQYSEPLRSIFNDPARCPDKYLLWFHHLPWDYILKNGNELWTELCNKYSYGVNQVKIFQESWKSMEGIIDEGRYNHINKKLEVQYKEALWWRDACLLYFQTFSGKDIPKTLATPVHNLEELKKTEYNIKSHN
ncbi:MAG: alpha-glucuronidase [Bacteroidales bacterium]|nr:alpha-glucuronidase [Bacteroidales bacterium]